LGDNEEEVWNREFLIGKQEEDEKLQMIANRKREGEQLTKAELQALSPQGRVWASLMDSIHTNHTGLTRYRYQHGTDSATSLVLLPPGMWKDAMIRAHEDVAHMGVAATA